MPLRKQLQINVYQHNCTLCVLQFHEENFALRQHLKHLEDCTALEDDPSLSTDLGINKRSSLLELQYVNICTDLLPDVMHDLLEGFFSMKLNFF